MRADDVDQRVGAHGDDHDEPVEGPSPYARRVGERLRAIRRQRGLSLHEVEAASAHEFKASVLGAYERGERAISVPRLERLARFFQVPVDQLLPREGEEAAEPEDRRLAPSRRDVGPGSGKVTIDLTRFEAVSDPEAEMLRRYVQAIQVQRQDFNGRMLTIRGDDVRALAGLLGRPPDTLVRRLEDLHLLLPR